MEGDSERTLELRQWHNEVKAFDKKTEQAFRDGKPITAIELQLSRNKLQAFLLLHIEESLLSGDLAVTADEVEAICTIWLDCDYLGKRHRVRELVTNVTDLHGSVSPDIQGMLWLHTIEAICTKLHGKKDEQGMLIEAVEKKFDAIRQCAINAELEGRYEGALRVWEKLGWMCSFELLWNEERMQYLRERIARLKNQLREKDEP